MRAGADNTRQWEELANALRRELAEYGGMLQLLEAQKQAVFAQNADALIEVNGQLEQQALAARDASDRRELLLASRLRALGLAAGSTLKDVIPMVPEMLRPLFEALLDETRSLADRTAEASRRNRVLMARSAEFSEQVLRRFRPQGMTKTYTARGGMALRTSRTGSLNLSA